MGAAGEGCEAQAEGRDAVKAEMNLVVESVTGDESDLREETAVMLEQMAATIRDGGVAGWSTKPPSKWTYRAIRDDVSSKA